jgi:hypothetical protein
MTPTTADPARKSQDASRPFAVRTCLVLAAAAYSYLAATTVVVVLAAAVGYYIPYPLDYWLIKARDLAIMPLGGLEDAYSSAVEVGLLLILSVVTFRRSLLIFIRRPLASWVWRIVNVYVLVTSGLVLGGLLCLVGLFLLMALVFAPMYLAK